MIPYVTKYITKMVKLFGTLSGEACAIVNLPPFLRGSRVNQLLRGNP